MSERVLLGMLTPSSNTVLEPMTAAILAGVPEISAHFGRFRVTEISLSDAALGQFDLEALLQSARLLADARVQVIAWNGTSGGWLGFEADRRLCKAIGEETGAAATTSTLALVEAFDALGARDIALVTPYLDDVQQRVIATYADAGYRCVAERHLGISDNFAFSEVTETQLEQLIREVADDGPQAIAVFCTNLRGARVAARVEQAIGIPVIDSVTVTVWKSLLLAGADPARIQGWGRLFAAPG